MNYKTWIIKQANKILEVDIEELKFDHELLKEKYDVALDRIRELNTDNTYIREDE